jgi:hypothetical protein
MDYITMAYIAQAHITAKRANAGNFRLQIADAKAGTTQQIQTEI